MTAFGALLGGGIGASGVEYGCICLGYASAFNYMVQNLPDNKSIYKNDDGSWTLSFRANEVARWAVPGCFMDTYIRGFVGHRRFVSQVNFRFTA